MVTINDGHNIRTGSCRSRPGAGGGHAAISWHTCVYWIWEQKKQKIWRKIWGKVWGKAWGKNEKPKIWGEEDREDTRKKWASREEELRGTWERHEEDTRKKWVNEGKRCLAATSWNPCVFEKKTLLFRKKSKGEMSMRGACEAGTPLKRGPRCNLLAHLCVLSLETVSFLGGDIISVC